MSLRSFHRRENENAFGCFENVNATCMDTSVLALKFLMTFKTALSAIFGEAKLSLLPSSQLPVRFNQTYLPEIIIGRDGAPYRSIFLVFRQSVVALFCSCCYTCEAITWSRVDFEGPSYA